jgi:NADP-reducing hydrogenase subunit HndB
MPKLKPEDLDRIASEHHRTMNLREGEIKVKITVHMGTCGIAAGARPIMNTILSELSAVKAKDLIVTTSGCAGLCSREPMVTVELKGKAPVKYVDLTEEKIKVVIKEHVLKGKMVKEYALAIGSERSG